MICAHCGHHNMLEDARFCGRCGNALRSAELPESAAIPDEEPYITADLAGEHLQATRRLRLSDPARASMARPVQPPPADHEPLFEVLLPEPWDLAAWATEPPIKAENEGPAEADEMPDARQPIATGSPGPYPIDPLSGILRAGGCTFASQGEQATLVEARLDVGVLCTVAHDPLLWTSDPPRLDLLLASPPAGAPQPGARRLQVSGPAIIALTPGPGHMAASLTLEPGEVIDMAPRALLAYTRGIRSLGMRGDGSSQVERLLADRAAVALLRLPCNTHHLDLRAGDWLTVAIDALIVRAGSVGCALLRRDGPSDGPLLEYRLTGPGRVFVGRSGPEEACP